MAIRELSAIPPWSEDGTVACASDAGMMPERRASVSRIKLGSICPRFPPDEQSAAEEEPRSKLAELRILGGLE